MRAGSWLVGGAFQKLKRQTVEPFESRRGCVKGGGLRGTSSLRRSKKGLLCFSVGAQLLSLLLFKQLHTQLTAHPSASQLSRASSSQLDCCKQLQASPRHEQWRRSNARTAPRTSWRSALADQTFRQDGGGGCMQAQRSSKGTPADPTFRQEVGLGDDASYLACDAGSNIRALAVFKRSMARNVRKLGQGVTLDSRRCMHMLRTRGMVTPPPHTHTHTHSLSHTHTHTLTHTHTHTHTHTQCKLCGAQWCCQHCKDEDKWASHSRCYLSSLPSYLHNDQCL